MSNTRIVGKDSAQSDVERRLTKALRLIEKLRNKYDFEKEVGQELALRNEALKKDLHNETERHKHAVASFEELYCAFSDLCRQHEQVLSDGLPTDPAAIDNMRSLLDDQRDTAERLKRFANPPSTKHKKKSRRASEVGINIQAELGTSLIRSMPGVPLDESVDSANDKAAPILNRKNTMALSSAGAGNEWSMEDTAIVSATPSRKCLLEQENSEELDYYEALGGNSMTPLFEHFIVVGVPAETAVNVLDKMRKEMESTEAVSSRWLRKLGLSKMMSNENSPAPAGRSFSNLTPERNVSQEFHSPNIETSRDSFWGITSPNVEDEDITTRATFSSPSLRANTSSTFSKFGKFFGSKETATDSSSETDRGSFFGKKTRRQSTPDVNPPDVDFLAAVDTLKRCDSAPGSVIAESPSTPDVTKSDHSIVFDSSEESKTKPPTVQDSDSRSMSNAFSRFGFNKKKPDTQSSSISFGLSFGRLSSSSMVHEDCAEGGSEATILKRLPNVDEIASSFLFNGEGSKAPQTHVVPKKAASLVEFSEDLDPDIIFRYPPNVAPPPVEVADFCMPVGAKLYRINPREEETMTLKILYSHEGHRSSRCFIFMLEDRTVSSAVGYEDDSAARLYGICVIHHRLVCSQKTTVNGGPIFEFVTPVCYCFITRFPLFDFFFQVIWSMISGERIFRMQGVQDHPDDEAYDRKSYTYVPEKTLSEILFALAKTKPPMFSERVVFSLPSASTVIEHIRLTPPGDMTEHDYNASSWALPCLLDWLSPQILTWAIGLLLCEVKVIVIGHEPGMVSCAVMSLMSLLKPLTWVAPLIPILPLKHIDFIEAPVPIIAGVVLHGEAFSMTAVTPQHSHTDASDPLSPSIGNTPVSSNSNTAGNPTIEMPAIRESSCGYWHPETAHILKKCLEKNSLTAVLDLTVADIYVSKSQVKEVQECSLPNMDAFLEAFSKARHADRSNSNVDSINFRGNPQYSVTTVMKEDAKSYQETMRTHLFEFLDSVESEYQRTMHPENSVVESHVERLKEERNRAMSVTRTPFTENDKVLESFASFASVVESANRNNKKSGVFGDEFSADVEEVTQNLADAVAAALRVDSTIGLDDRKLSVNTDDNNDDIDAIVGVSNLPRHQNDVVQRAAFLKRFFQTQIFSEYMDELNLGMECLADNEGGDNIGAECASANVNLDALGSHAFSNDSTGCSKRHSFDCSAINVGSVHGHRSSVSLGRPASMEFTSSGVEKSGRKGRLSMIINGPSDITAEIPVVEEDADDLIRNEI